MCIMSLCEGIVFCIYIVNEENSKIKWPEKRNIFPSIRFSELKFNNKDNTCYFYMNE